MPHRPTDRRTARSRNRIEAAQLSLILSKGYDATSVQDICDQANVGRSTFYAHYRSKDDLKRNALLHLRRQLAERQQTARASIDDGPWRPFAFGLPLFEHARAHLSLYRSLAGSRGREVALDAIRRMLRELVREEVASPMSRPGTKSALYEVTVEAVVGAYMAALTWWLDRGACLEPAEVDAAVRRLVGHSLQ